VRLSKLVYTWVQPVGVALGISVFISILYVPLRSSSPNLTAEAAVLWGIAVAAAYGLTSRTPWPGRLAVTFAVWCSATALLILLGPSGVQTPLAAGPIFCLVWRWSSRTWAEIEHFQPGVNSRFPRPPSLLYPSDGELQEIRRISEELLLRFPHATETIQATVAVGLGRPEGKPVAVAPEAIVMLEAACGKHPECCFLRCRLCDLYVDLNRFADALGVARQLVLEFPYDPRASHALASIYYRLSRWRKEELSARKLALVQRRFSCKEMDEMLQSIIASEAIVAACDSLGLTPLRASELAEQYFKRTLELGVIPKERLAVEHGYRWALRDSHNRRMGLALDIEPGEKDDESGQRRRAA